MSLVLNLQFTQSYKTQSACYCEGWCTDIMLEEVNFVYDGVSSTEMGLLNVRVDSPGMFDEQFLAGKEIQEVTVRGRDKPYLQNVKRNPLSLSLSFAFENAWDTDKIRRVARWLDQDQYKPFYVESSPDRIYYCMLSSDSKLFHNGSNQGYITITMRCDSPYTYTPHFVSPEYDYSTNPVGGTAFVFSNTGDTDCSPELWITKVGNGNVRIVNSTNGGIEFIFTGLLNAEVVYIDNENDYIESSLQPITYRYDSFNNNFMELVRGNNNLMIYGTCKLQWRYEFTTKQG